MALPQLDARGLRRLVAEGRLADECGPAVVLVGAAANGAPPDIGSEPCVVIGRTDDPFAAGADVVVSEADLEVVAAAIRATPIAATSFAVLLRVTEHLDVHRGLAAESSVYSTLQGGAEFARWRAARPIKDPSMSSEGACVLAVREGAILHVTLNRPHRHNAFSRQMRDELTEALTLAEIDGTIERVIVDGTGPSFCSGGDLDEFGSRPDPAIAHVTRLTRSPARLMHRLSGRTEVRLHGAAIGAGIELPAFASRVLAHPATRIALPELGLGLVPGAGGTVSLPRRIGRQRTAWLGLTGASIDAATALAWGLVDAVEPVQRLP